MFNCWPKDPNDKYVISDSNIDFCGIKIKGTTISFAISIFLIIEACSAIVASFTFPYVLNSWLEFFGKEPVVAWWHGALFGLFPKYAACMIPGAMITWVAMLFLS